METKAKANSSFTQIPSLDPLVASSASPPSSAKAKHAKKSRADRIRDPPDHSSHPKKKKKRAKTERQIDDEDESEGEASQSQVSQILSLPPQQPPAFPAFLAPPSPPMLGEAFLDSETPQFPPPAPSPPPSKQSEERAKAKVAKPRPTPTVSISGAGNAYELGRAAREAERERRRQARTDRDKRRSQRWQKPPRSELALRGALGSLGISERIHPQLYAKVLLSDTDDSSHIPSLDDSRPLPSLKSAKERCDGRLGSAPQRTPPPGLPIAVRQSENGGINALCTVKKEPVKEEGDGKKEDKGMKENIPIISAHSTRFYAQENATAKEEEFLQMSSCRCLAVLDLAMCRGCLEGEREAEEAKEACLFRRIRRISFHGGTAFVSGWYRFEDETFRDREMRKRLFSPSAQSKRCLGWSYDEAAYTLQCLAQPFHELVREQTEFLRSLAPEKRETMGIYRGGEGHRELCDLCSANILNLHLMCTECGLLLCPACLAESNSESESFAAPDLLCTANEEAHRLTAETMALAQLHPDEFPYLADTMLRVETHLKAVMKERRIPQGCECSEGKSEDGNCFCEKVAQTGKLLPPPSKPATSAKDVFQFMDEDPPTHAPPPLPTDEEVVGDAEDDGGDWEGQVAETLSSRPPRLSGTLSLRRANAKSREYLVLNALEHPPPLSQFQNRWRKGEPVLVTGVHGLVPWARWRKMWNFRRLSKHDSQDAQGQIMDCLRHLPVTRLLARKFWEGYGDLAERERDRDSNDPLPLKYKDYPSHVSFKVALQPQFRAYCATIPLPKYSSPQGGDSEQNAERGKFNLVRALPPEIYVIPDLGPKMYTAYGMLFNSAKAKGSTNLHCDISDAVNVLVDTTVPQGQIDGMDSSDWHRIQIEAKLGEEGVEGAEKERLLARWWEAGAVWTIWTPEDTLKLRHWLRQHTDQVKAASICGQDTSKLGVAPDVVNDWLGTDDPIHDQAIYINSGIRAMAEEAGIRGFTFVQCLGEAVFIPAGAAHQVQNLLSCVKVAEDFVTPEGVSKCAEIAGQCRHLSSRHANKEDKLQLSNILLHSIKEALAAIDNQSPK